MKSFLFIITIAIAISIGCTNKSDGSQSSAVGRTTVQSSPAPSLQTQERVPCTLKSAAAPTIHGLRLGMTPTEVLALFPGTQSDPEVQARLAKPPNQFGESELQIRPAKYQSNDQPLDVGQVGLIFVDGRVARVRIGFNGPQYSDVDQFVSKVIADSNLPQIIDWQPYVGMENSLKTLKCSEFEVSVFAGGKGGNLNYLEMHDLVAEKKVDDRRAKAEAQQNPTPKP